MTARTCKRCGAEIDASVHSCTAWADHPVPHVPVHQRPGCRACGATIRDGARFCTRCGAARDGRVKSPAPERSRGARVAMCALAAAIGGVGGALWGGAKGDAGRPESSGRHGGRVISAAARADSRSLTARIEAIARASAPAASKALAPSDLVGGWKGVIVALDVMKADVAVSADVSKAPPMDFRIVAAGGDVELVPDGAGLRRRVLESRDGRVVGRGEPPLSLSLGLGDMLVGTVASNGRRIEFHATRAR